MARFEYKVVPAPTKGRRARGVRGRDMRFAHTLETLMNELAEQGWMYLRTDTLPSEERQGLTGRNTVYQNMLVFHRAVEVPEEKTRADVPEEQPEDKLYADRRQDNQDQRADPPLQSTKPSEPTPAPAKDPLENEDVLDDLAQTLKAEDASLPGVTRPSD